MSDHPFLGLVFLVIGVVMVGFGYYGSNAPPSQLFISTDLADNSETISSLVLGHVIAINGVLYIALGWRKENPFLKIMRRRRTFRRDNASLPRTAARARCARRSSQARQVMLAAFVTQTVALGTMFAMVPAHAGETEEKFIRESINLGYEILNSTTISSEERSVQFRSYMLSLTDTKRIALFTLGQYANQASSREMHAFVEAYTEYALARYEMSLLSFREQTLTVVGSVDLSHDDCVVRTDLSNPSIPNAPAIKAAFRVRANASGDPIIIDMQVEGVWLAISQRADFTSYLQQHAGNVTELTKFLEQSLPLPP